MEAVAPGMEDLAHPSAEEVQAQLRRILGSTDFVAPERRRRFLAFVVDETLAGRAKSLKGVAIAISVFDRDESFDQQSDPVVRLEARRLRHDLDSYYAGAGRDDPIRISIPKGSYVPQFARQEVAGQAGRKAFLGAAGTGPVGERPKAAAVARRWIPVAAVILALLVVGALGWQLSGGERGEVMTAQASPEPQPARTRGPSIAVLPFLHLSGDTGRQYVTDGITEQIATALAQFRDLWVLPLGTMQKYNTGLADPRELKRDFAADFALEGSVLEVGNSIRITARLIDVAGARYVWVKRFDAAFTPASIYEMEDTITREVVGNLAGKYGVLAQNDMMHAKRKAPESLDAYDCVLRYYDYQMSISQSQHEEVKACLERAVVLAPQYAEAWAVLANLYMQEICFGLGPPETRGEVLAKAKAAVKRSLALDPADPTGHLMLSNLLFSEGDLAGFHQSGKAALDLNPNNSSSLAHYGMRLALSGDWDRGLQLVMRALTLHAVHPQWYHFPEVFYRYDRREYEAALAELERIDMPNFVWTHLFRAAILGQLNRLEEARTAAQDLLALRPRFRQEATGLIRVWQIPEPLYQSILEGLSKAGLEITTEASLRRK